MPLVCEKIYKQFSHTKVLNGIDLEIRDGEYVAIMGKSGAGKSTLLNIMAGLDRPTEGHVIYNDVCFNECSDEKLAEYRRRQFGFIFQFYNLIPELTLYENVVLPIQLDGRKVDKTEAGKIIDQFELTERKNSFPNTLSGGEQQRAAIMRAIVHKPQIIFADEPTGNLDEESSNGFLKILHEIRERLHSTIVLVTHDAAVARRADRIVHITDGRITSEA